MGFKTGDKVVCLSPTDNLEKDYVYTIKNTSKPDVNGAPTVVWLEESEYGYLADRFGTIGSSKHQVLKYKGLPKGITPDMSTLQNPVDAGMIHNEGRKDDTGKPDMTDIPLEAMWQMGQAFTYGQKKYSKNNYRNGMAISRQLAAAVRHIFQHLNGESTDPESGVTHLGHAMASLAMAVYNLANNPKFDDRFEKDVKKHEKI